MHLELFASVPSLWLQLKNPLLAVLVATHADIVNFPSPFGDKLGYDKDMLLLREQEKIRGWVFRSNTPNPVNQRKDLKKFKVGVAG